MTTVLPPRPPELAERIISDAAAHVDVPRELLAARAAADLATHAQPGCMIEGEDVAARHVDAMFGDDAAREVYARALDRVRRDYLAQAELVGSVVEDLVEHGSDAWIAQALRHRFAFDVAWEALDRLGELQRFPPITCPGCGAEVEVG